MNGRISYCHFINDRDSNSHIKSLLKCVISWLNILKGIYSKIHHLWNVNVCKYGTSHKHHSSSFEVKSIKQINQFYPNLYTCKAEIHRYYFVFK